MVPAQPHRVLGESCRRVLRLFPRSCLSPWGHHIAELVAGWMASGRRRMGTRGRAGAVPQALEQWGGIRFDREVHSLTAPRGPVHDLGSREELVQAMKHTGSL